MKASKVAVADNFFGMIKGLSAEVRLDLISKISNSLKGANVEDSGDSWKDLFGAWQSDLSAEEIVEGVRESRYTDRHIEEL